MQFYLLTILLIGASIVHSAPPAIFVCSSDNDIYNLLNSDRIIRFDTLHDALQVATEKQPLYVLADAYPWSVTRVTKKEFQQIAKLKIPLYIEFPSHLPNAISINGTQELDEYSRLVVVTDEIPDLGNNTIIFEHDSYYTTFKFSDPTEVDVLLVYSLVAGYRKVAFEVENTTTVLFRYNIMDGHSILVSNTKLSNVVSGRYAPIADWVSLWNFIFNQVSPGRGFSISSWQPTVRPAYGRYDVLPKNAEKEAFYLATDWTRNKSGLFLTGGRPGDNVTAYCPAPYAHSPSQIACVLEGFQSEVFWNGTQPLSADVRMDCNGPIAMALSYRYLMDGDEELKEDIKRILDYLFFYSEAQQGPRNNASNPVYGLLAWGVSSEAWFAGFYGDSDGSCIIGCLVAASILDSNRWDESFVKNFLANLRTSNQNGFRPGRIDFDQFQENGWEYYYNSTYFYDPSAWPQPHYSSMLYAEFLWAYQHTGFDLFLNHTYTAIKHTMLAYPYEWIWTEYMTEEQGKFLIALAWLVRVKDTPETRGWLKLVATDFLSTQADFGAVNEKLGPRGQCQFCPPNNNADYGTGECGLIQYDSDPCTDMLYTHNFAVMGLREAYRATGDSFYYDAETKMIEFLIRIQVRSSAVPSLDGAWLRAFDYELWDFYGSAADIGWGPWSIESGWSEGWIAATLAERLLETSIWETTESSTVSPNLVVKYCPKFFTGQYEYVCDDYVSKLKSQRKL